jgi:hypothetical protein
MPTITFKSSALTASPELRRFMQERGSAPKQEAAEEPFEGFDEKRFSKTVDNLARQRKAAEVDDDAVEILRLANLSAIKYEQERQTSADKLGMRVAVLDSVVKAERSKITKEQTDFLPHWNKSRGRIGLTVLPC